MSRLTDVYIDRQIDLQVDSAAGGVYSLMPTL